MKAKSILTVLLLLAVCAGTCTFISCSKDDTEENAPSDNNETNSESDNNEQQTQEIVVTVDAYGNADGGHHFTRIDDTNFYIDDIKYTAVNGNLEVTGYNKAFFKGAANIISTLIYVGRNMSIVSISGSAFDNCKVLTSVTIPNSVKSIGSSFEDCTSLTSVTFGSGITDIGHDAFCHCRGITSVYITDLASWCNIIFHEENSNPLFHAHHLYLNGKEINNLILPDDVMSISRWAFIDCTSLTSVTIPKSVTSIDYGAFSGCSSLTDVYCYATTPPSIYYGSFDESSIGEHTTLHVPAGSIDTYIKTWSSFKSIVAIE